MRLLPAASAILGLALAAAACAPANRIEFVLCPSEVSAQMARTGDLGARRELLYPLDYEVVIVERRGDAVAPAVVLRAQHSYGSPRPTATTLADPTHVSDWFIVDRPAGELGIAIRRDSAEPYRVQWLSDSDLADARRTAVIHLQPIATLPLLPPP
jgi:hypothetical protein